MFTARTCGNKTHTHTTHTLIPVYTHTHAHTSLHTHIRTYTRTYTHTHTHTYKAKNEFVSVLWYTSIIFQDRTVEMLDIQ